MPAISRNIVEVDLRATITICSGNRAEQLAPLIDLQRLPGIQHGSAREKCCRCGSAGIRRIDGHNPELSSTDRIGGCVIEFAVVSSVREPSVLPTRAVVPALRHQFKITVKSLETTRHPHRCRNLSLKPGFRMVFALALSLGHVDSRQER